MQSNSERIAPKRGAIEFTCRRKKVITLLGNTPPLVARTPGPNTISGLKDNGTGIGRLPGEYVVTLSVFQADNEWNYRLTVRNAGDADGEARGGSVINETESKWPNLAGRYCSSGVSNQTEASLGMAPLVLLNFRALPGTTTGASDSDQGAMLWVDVAK